jgi:NADPH:quinone reductase-like Zn-dependent oxidoreductase
VSGQLPQRMRFVDTTGKGRPGTGPSANASTSVEGRLVQIAFLQGSKVIEARKVRPVIDRIFPLAEAAAAHKLMETSRHIGKILLVTG